MFCWFWVNANVYSQLLTWLQIGFWHTSKKKGDLVTTRTENVQDKVTLPYSKSYRDNRKAISMTAYS